MVQLNIEERFLNPLEDPRRLSTKEERRTKVEKTVLCCHNAACLTHELENGATHILAATPWLKLKKKYFNSGTVKEACGLFNVTAKNLSRVLTGKKYLGGAQAHAWGPMDRGKKRKSMKSVTAVKSGGTNKGDDNDNDGGHTTVKGCTN